MSKRRISAEGRRKLIEKIKQIPTPKRVGESDPQSADELGFWAELTEFSLGTYSWKRKTIDIADPSGFVDFAPEATGFYAHDAGLSEGSRVGEIVFLHFGYVDTTAESPEMHFWFEGGGADTGVYQYTVHMMVADNVAGWDYVRGHP